ncbi:MAG TPA: hypothetical protein VHP58_06310 [Alphaproteobacteria bacterium]|nr:hypothetical protein [Alphaproteobacteria bacterium]
MTKLTLPLWNDWHMHARQGADCVPEFLQAHKAMGCCGILAMPNTKPPVARVDGEGPGQSIVEYRHHLIANGADKFEHLFTPLWLSNITTPQMIEQGAKSGLLKSCKYYPPHATTGSHAHGELTPMPFGHYVNNGVFRAMEEHGIILNIHGEAHDLIDEDWFDEDDNAESRFYENMYEFVKDYGQLRIVFEHITTKVAVAFVESFDVGATICPQHLLYTTGTLIRHMAVHLLCMPVVKFYDDRMALRHAVTDRNNTRFFAGTDSAPHFRGMKETPCGCAAGCFTGGIAPQLYAQAFEEAGCSLDAPENAKAFENFLVHNGNRFYGVETSKKTFTLERKDYTVQTLKTHGGEVVPLPVGMKRDVIPWSITHVDA